jgi:hypothetical protein
VRNAWEQGIVRAASIGFIPLQLKPNDLGGEDYLTWDLMEISLVPLPANPEAVRRLKALGLTPREAIPPEVIEAIRRGIEQGIRRVLTGR